MRVYAIVGSSDDVDGAVFYRNMRRAFRAACLAAPDKWGVTVYALDVKNTGKAGIVACLNHIGFAETCTEVAVARYGRVMRSKATRETGPRPGSRARQHLARRAT
jgi:hypothetical protein